MHTKEYDVLVIGAGAAGLAACKGALEQGAQSILLAEQSGVCGGILNQCIHNGFGLHTFQEELTGPAYAHRVQDVLQDPRITCLTNATVTSLTPDREAVILCPEQGYFHVKAGAVILATGSKERTRGAIRIPGTRPAGIYTAGQAQKHLNLDGHLVGRSVFILGSGDIGLIMARRMKLEGANVLGVAELMPYSNGLARNIRQCLDDFDIPLYLSHTVTNIEGRDRLEAIVLSEVDAARRPIPGTERRIEADTLLLSVGLIPDHTLAEQLELELDPVTKGPVVDQYDMTSVPGIFACGNGLHIHDLVDFVTMEGLQAGRSAMNWLKQGGSPETIANTAGAGIAYVVPQRIRKDGSPADCFFRVREPGKKVTIRISNGQRTKEIRKPAVHPSGMEKVRLTPDLMETGPIVWEVCHD